MAVRAERFDLVQHGVDAFVREPLRHDGDAARERHFRGVPRRVSVPAISL
jgi:hypothetical protein